MVLAILSFQKKDSKKRSFKCTINFTVYPL